MHADLEYSTIQIKKNIEVDDGYNRRFIDFDNTYYERFRLFGKDATDDRESLEEKACDWLGLYYDEAGGSDREYLCGMFLEDGENKLFRFPLKMLLQMQTALQLLSNLW